MSEDWALVQAGLEMPVYRAEAEAALARLQAHQEEQDKEIQRLKEKCGER